MPSLLDVLLPAACSGCGRLGDVVCRTCRNRFRPAGLERDRFLAPDAGTVIGEVLTLALAAFAHEGPLRKALEHLKYAGASRAASPIAAAALPTLRRLLSVSGPATLVAVPIHAARLRQRGYNQAALIADALGRACGLRVDELLLRSRDTTKQHRLDRTARLRNLQDAFAPASTPLPAVPVIVVDDILTTSATLEACARVLVDAGCGPIYGLAIAREV